MMLPGRNASSEAAEVVWGSLRARNVKVSTKIKMKTMRAIMVLGYDLRFIGRSL